jgi:hypothetical protein
MCCMVAVVGPGETSGSPAMNIDRDGVHRIAPRLPERAGDVHPCALGLKERQRADVPELESFPDRTLGLFLPDGGDAAFTGGHRFESCNPVTDWKITCVEDEHHASPAGQHQVAA